MLPLILFYYEFNSYPRAEAVVALSFVSLLFALPLQAQVDYDTDEDGLIDVTTLEQLNAVRWDLDGNGAVASAQETAYGKAFPNTVSGSTYEAITCGDGSTITTCSGYELMNDLDFEVDDSYASGSKKLAWIDPDHGGTTDTEGWDRIGDGANSFAAVFEGNDHTISNLYIDRPTNSHIGLFAALNSSGEVRNLGIEGGSVTAAAFIGGLVGSNFGTISGCYTTGNATGTDVDTYVGGLVGQNDGGSIVACYATGTVTGTDSLAS